MQRIALSSIAATSRQVSHTCLQANSFTSCTHSIAASRSTSITSSSSAAALKSFSATRCFSSATSSSSSSSSTPPTSFIAHAKQHGALSLLHQKLPTSGRFDSCLSSLHITKIDTTTGDVEAELLIDEKVENSYGTLHGGAISTIVDVMGTLALLAKDHTRGGVSVDLNVSFLAAMPVGEKITCKGRVLKLGKKLGFTQVDLYTSEGKLAATGRHTKAM